MWRPASSERIRSFDERGNKVRQARNRELASNCLCPSGAHPRPGAAGVYSCRGIHVTIKQTGAEKRQDSKGVDKTDNFRKCIQRGWLKVAGLCRIEGQI